MRTVLLSLHILAIAVWFGGSIMNGIINANVMKQDSLEGSAALARAEAKLGMTVYMPAAVVTLLTGFGLLFAIDTPYGIGDPWVSFGMLTVIVAAVMGPLKFQPLTDRMIEQYDAGDKAGGAATGMEIGKWSSITTGLLLLSIVLMVAKPGG